MIINMDSKKFKDNIFKLQTRKFGTVGELILEKILVDDGFIVDKSKNISYDRLINNEQNEIKCSRVLANSRLKIDTSNIIEVIENYDSKTNINFENCEEHKWDCNIQQIKFECFETLWYSLFFDDKVAFFRIEKNKIIEDKNIAYSDKQHRGNKGEGQFHVTNKNIKHHIDNYLVIVLTYDEIYNKLK